MFEFAKAEEAPIDSPRRSVREGEMIIGATNKNYTLVDNIFAGMNSTGKPFDNRLRDPICIPKAVWLW